jgi:hypothetical protein
VLLGSWPSIKNVALLDELLTRRVSSRVARGISNGIASPAARNDNRDMVTRSAGLTHDTRGGHRQLKHPTTSGRVTVSGEMRGDLANGIF